jgi:mRNA interferase ChpB
VLVKQRRVPLQGDIVLVSLDPTAGQEIRGRRPVLVLSNLGFNKIGVALVAPITQGGNFERVAGWAVTLMESGTATQGAIVVSQSKALDLHARNGKTIEAVPQFVLDEVLAKLAAMTERH